MGTLYLKPARGRVVRDPLTGKPLPPHGGRRPYSVFWMRRIRDGDVIEAEPPARRAAKPSKAGRNKAGQKRKP